MNELINKLLAKDFEIHIGKHTKSPGYFAGVFPQFEIPEAWKVCESCGHFVLRDLWESNGHGLTVEEALKNAILIAEGKEPETEYNPEENDV